MRASSVNLMLAFCLLLQGCGSTPANVSTGDPSEFPQLPGRFAEQPVTTPLTMLEAYIGDDNFYVKFDGPDGIVHAGGNWSNRLDLSGLLDDQAEPYTGPHILPLDYQQKERWSSLPDDLIIPRMLSAEQWIRFSNELFASILPDTPKTGIAMHFDKDDYFMFINDAGLLETHLLTEMPTDHTIVESISFQDFLERGLPELEAFLAHEGVTERRIAFSTGDMGAYSLPFLFVDRQLPLAVFVRYGEKEFERRGGQATQVAQSTAHILQSHTGSLAVRPVSSIFRLLFATGDAAVETVRPTWLVTLEQQPIPEVNNGPPMDLELWEQEVDRIAGSATSGEIQFLIDGQEYFTRLIDALNAATTSIHIRTYIFDNDDFAERIGRLLQRKAGEGVEVKVLLDGLGTILATGAEDESMPADYVPPPSVREFLESGSDVEVRQARNPWLAGDHVKTTIIDDEIAFTGGMNIGREYRYTWHDMMMEVNGPVVDVLRHEFSNAWAHAGMFGDFGYALHRLKRQEDLAAPGGQPLRVLFTRAGDPQIFRVQQAAIRNAQSYIYIQNAYFTDDAMLFELARARKRGVDVRVILPLVGNHGPINKSNILAANALLEHGVRVFLYPGMSHVKAAVFDGWVCLGSANWDKLSFRINKELNLATSYPPAVAELQERLFDVDFAASVELTEPFPERWSDHLVELLADYFL